MRQEITEGIFHIDMHVHSSRYSQCAEFLDPHKIEYYAQKAGIHGVVITEHDTLWKPDQLEALQREMPSVLLLNGIEVTTENGCHLVLIGLNGNGPLHKGIPIEKAISYAHEESGIAILAHPFRNGLPSLQSIEKVDAIEIGSTSLNQRESTLSQYLAEVLQKPTIGCSDAHALSRIGWAYTRFPEQPQDAAHLCRLVKSGLGEPIMPNSFPG